MARKPKLSDIDGIGPAMEEKLREAGIKSPVSLSKADPEKLAEEVSGLGIASATDFIAQAKKLLSDYTKSKETKKTKTEEKPKKTAKKKKAESEKPEAEKKKEAPKRKKVKKEPKKEEAKPAKPKTEKKAAPEKEKKPEPEFVTKDTLYDKRLLRIAAAKRKRKPKFRHEQAHRWKRVSDSWRKVRGIDSATREKRRGRIAMVSAGYRTPKSVRGLHPSGYEEVHVFRPDDLEGLDPDVHAVRIGGTVGLRKRQDIINKAESMMLRVLNAGVPEGIEEEDLFAELDGLEDLEEVDFE